MSEPRSGVEPYLSVGMVVEVRRGDYSYNGTVVGITTDNFQVFIKDREGTIQVIPIAQVAVKKP